MNSKVTVLMPVHNGEAYLKEAMDSILSQTFKDFEFLIINDGSTDNSVEIIESYNDLRIRLVNNEENIGLAETLNKGIELASGEYIARMDCDDISLPKRLEKQVKFLDLNPDVSICGTGRILFGNRDDVITYIADKHLTGPKLLFECCLAHPTVIFRKYDFKKHNLKYRKEFIVAQDYDLWSRTSKNLKIANLKEILFKYREHGKQLTSKEETLKQENIAIWRQLLEFFGVEFSEEELKIHEKIALYKIEPTAEFMESAKNWLLKLKKHNDETSYYSKNGFDKIIGNYLFELCWINRKMGLSSWEFINKSEISKFVKMSIFMRIQMYFKCLRYELKNKAGRQHA